MRSRPSSDSWTAVPTQAIQSQLRQAINGDETAAMKALGWLAVYYHAAISAFVIQFVARAPAMPETIDELCLNFEAWQFQRERLIRDYTDSQRKGLSLREAIRGNLRRNLADRVRYWHGRARESHGKRSPTLEVPIESMTLEQWNQIEPRASSEAEAWFDASCHRETLERAIALVRQDWAGDLIGFELLMRALTEEGRQIDIANEAGINPATFKKDVSRLRQDIRIACRTVLAQILLEPAQVDQEMKVLEEASNSKRPTT